MEKERRTQGVGGVQTTGGKGPGVAIVGAGFMGKVHAQAALSAGGRLVGVVSSRPSRAKAIAQEFAAEDTFEGAEQLISDPRVTVVHVCTPNSSHYPLAKMALEAGKHVVCEKPLAISIEHAVELVELARTRHLVSAVPFVYRYHAMATEARTRILAGAAGRIRLVHGSYLQDWLADSSDTNWRVDADLGGPSRAFADIGSHWCDLVEWMIGQRIDELVAQTATVIPERLGHIRRSGDGRSLGPATIPVDTEDIASVLFRTAGGVLGNVVISQVSQGRKNRLWLEVDGSDASVTFDQENPEYLLLGDKSGTKKIPRDSSYLGLDAQRLSWLPPGHSQGYLDCFRAFTADVYTAMGSGERNDYPTFEDGLRTVRITKSVLDSARSRSWVKVPEETGVHSPAGPLEVARG